MTGFGSVRFRVGDWTFELELRSVNHRHFDARIRLPRLLANLEPDVRARLANRLARGRIDLTVAAPEGGAPAPRLEVDLAAAREYLAAARALAQSDGVSGELDARALLALPGVSRFVEPELADGLLREHTLAAVDQGIEALSAMRASEGAALARDLCARLDRVGELAGEIEQRSGLVTERSASACASARASSRRRPAARRGAAAPGDRDSPPTAWTSPRRSCGCAAISTSSARCSTAPVPGGRSGASSSSCSRSSCARRTRSARRAATRRSRTGWWS
jgi:uncharacterized protein YicC (UPF0701 family)